MIQHILFFAIGWLLCVLSIKTGFGQGLLMLPVLISLVGTRQAVPMLAVAQLMTALFHVPRTTRHIRWRTTGLFLLGAAPCCILGAIVFVMLPKEASTRLIGLAILYFAVCRRLNSRAKSDASSGMPFRLAVRGAVAGALSGATGSSAALDMRAFAGQGLTLRAFAASLAAVGVALHGLKMLVYQNFIEFDWRFWRLGAVVTAAMLLASWRNEPTNVCEPVLKTQRAVELCLVVAAAYLLVHGTAP